MLDIDTIFVAVIYHTTNPKQIIKFTVSIAPEPSLSWYRDDVPVDENEKYHVAKENLGTCHLDVGRLEFVDQVSMFLCQIKSNEQAIHV